jgi:hypothetical protein
LTVYPGLIDSYTISHCPSLPLALAGSAVAAVVSFCCAATAPAALVQTRLNPPAYSPR